MLHLFTTPEISNLSNYLVHLIREFEIYSTTHLKPQFLVYKIILQFLEFSEAKNLMLEFFRLEHDGAIQTLFYH